MTADIRTAAERTVRLDHLIGVYAVGSGDWSWQEEYAKLYERDYQRALTEQIRVNGITEPILLGNDGRVWDGHHRICAAMHIGIDSVPVEFSNTHVPRVAPTREQVADAIRGAVKIGWVGPNSQAILRDGGTVHLTPDEAESGADAVLELLQELAKVDHGSERSDTR